MFALQEQRVRSIADQVAAHGGEFAPEVQDLLMQGGVRVAAEQAAGSEFHDFSP